jgi:WD40 repeat protein
VLYGAFESGHIAGWNASNGQLVAHLQGHKGNVTAMQSFSSMDIVDSKSPGLISASLDGTIRVWRGVGEAAAAAAAVAAGLSLNEAGLKQDLEEPVHITIENIEKTVATAYEPLKMHTLQGSELTKAVADVIACARQHGAKQNMLSCLEDALSKSIVFRSTADVNAMLELEDLLQAKVEELEVRRKEAEANTTEDQGACCLFVLEFGTRSAVADFFLRDHLLIGSSWDGRVRSLNLRHRTCTNIVEIRSETRLTSICKGDENIVFIGLEDGSISQWHFSSHASSSSTEVLCWKAHQGAVTKMRLLTGQGGEVVDEMMALSSGLSLIYDSSRPDYHQRFTTSKPAIPTTKTWLLSASEDRTICMWSAVDGTLLKEFFGHTGGVLTTWHAKGDRLIWSGSRDHSLRSWSLEEADTLIRERDHMGKADAASRAIEIANAKANKKSKDGKRKGNRGKKEDKKGRSTSPGSKKKSKSPKGSPKASSPQRKARSKSPKRADRLAKG